MSQLPFQIIGFDLDGTLLETHRDLGAAVNHALELGGFEKVPADHASDLIGGGAKIMLMRAVDEQGGLPEEEFRKLYKAMLAFYAENNAVHTRPYPNAAEVLADLDDRGIAMVVVTNKFESFASQILESLGLRDRFAGVIGGDTMGKGRSKPAPDPIFEAKKHQAHAIGRGFCLSPRSLWRDKLQPPLFHQHSDRRRINCGTKAHA